MRATMVGTSPERQRAAFTLLEILLAMALSLILVFAVYKSLDIQWRYSTSGQQEMERDQIARAILQMMAIDIRSVVYTPPGTSVDDEDESTEANDAIDDGTDDEPEESVVVEDPDDEYETTSSLGAMGDGTTILLDVSRPLSPLKGTGYHTLAEVQAGSGSRASDLARVSYFMLGSGGPLQQAAAAELSTRQEEAIGLARLEGDRLTMQLADEQGNVATMTDQTQHLAAEVTSLQFRYFDGVDWLDTWDTVTAEALPLAVEINLGLANVDDEEDSSRRSDEPVETEQIYRLVVALPLAERYTPEE